MGLPPKAWPSFYMLGSHINTESARTKFGPIRDLKLTVHWLWLSCW